MVIAYGTYWIGSWLLGPRYYYEGLFSLILLSAAGITWLAGLGSEAALSITKRRIQSIRFIIIVTVVCLLILGNFYFYLPLRVGNLQGLYGISSEQVSPFLPAGSEALTPALIIVHPQKKWLEYGGLLDLSSPYLDTPFIFIHDRGKELNNTVINQFSDRKIWYYYPDEPFSFYEEPRD